MAESKVLARICVAAFLLYLPLQLLWPVLDLKSLNTWIGTQAAGNWMQLFGALGSIAAAVVALYFGTSAIRSSARAEEAKAWVIIDRLVPEVSQTKAALDVFTFQARIAYSDQLRLEALRTLLKELSAHAQVRLTQEEWAALYVFDKSCAGRLAEANRLVTEITRRAEAHRFGKIIPIVSTDDLMHMFVICSSMANEARQLLGTARRRMSEFYSELDGAAT